MKRLVPVLALLALSGCGGGAPDQEPSPSVLVTTVAPARGSAPIWLTAYGTATPLSTASVTLSVNQPGQVTRLLVTQGAGVRQGQPILTFTLAPTARSNLTQAETQLRVAREQLATTQRLLGQQLATRDQLAQAQKGVSDAQAALAALRGEGAGQAVQTLRAPFDGVVTSIAIAQGDRTQAGAALATVAKAQGIVVTVGVPAGQAAAIHPGAPARLQPLDGSAAVAGRVERVDRAADPQTKLVDVDIGFPAGAIIAGAGATAEIATGTASGWLVPHDAVVTAEGEPHVFQVVSGTARAVPVAVVEPGSPDDLVTGAIDPGRPLIVSGAFQVEDGGAVRVRAGR